MSLKKETILKCQAIYKWYSFLLLLRCSLLFKPFYKSKISLSHVLRDHFPSTLSLTSVNAWLSIFDTFSVLAKLTTSIQGTTMTSKLFRKRTKSSKSLGRHEPVSYIIIVIIHVRKKRLPQSLTSCLCSFCV